MLSLKNILNAEDLIKIEANENISKGKSVCLNTERKAIPLQLYNNITRTKYETQIGYGTYYNKLIPIKYNMFLLVGYVSGTDKLIISLSSVTYNNDVLFLSTQYSETTLNDTYNFDCIKITDEKVVIAYAYNSVGRMRILVVTCDVDNKSINVGPEQEITGSYYYTTSLVKLNENTVVLMGSAAQSGNASPRYHICTIQDNNITVGPRQDSTITQMRFSKLVGLTESKFAVVGYDENYYIYTSIATVSGTTINYSSINYIDYGGGDTAHLYNFDATKIDQNNILIVNGYKALHTAYAVTATINGDTISYNTKTELPQGNCYANLTPLKNNYFICNIRTSNGSPLGYLTTVSGTTITFPEDGGVTLGSNDKAFNVGVYIEDYGKIINIFNNSNPQDYYSITEQESNIDGFIGLAQNDVNQNETIYIKYIGSVDENQTNLVEGKWYYLSRSGKIIPEDTGNRLGKALSDTKLLLTY